MKTKGPIKDAVELLDEEVARLDAENKLLRSKITYVESLLSDGAFTLALEAIRAEYVE